MHCMKNFFIVPSLCLLLFGCAHETRYTGVVVRQTDLKQLRVNESKVLDVYKTLGAPTFVSIESPRNLLHYASCCMKISPTRSATIKSLVIYTLSIDKKGILQNITKTTQLRDFSYEQTSTPSVFKRASFVEEFLASSAARFK